MSGYRSWVLRRMPVFSYRSHSEECRQRTLYAIIAWIGTSIIQRNGVSIMAYDERGPKKMLREESLRYIRAVAGEFGAARVFLFGSCLSQSQDHAHDIDLAVEGISEDRLDAFWDRLMWAEALGRKPVDVIRLEDGHWLNPIILDEGVLIYEEQLSSVAL